MMEKKERELHKQTKMNSHSVSIELTKKQRYEREKGREVERGREKNKRCTEPKVSLSARCCCYRKWFRNEWKLGSSARKREREKASCTAAKSYKIRIKFEWQMHQSTIFHSANVCSNLNMHTLIKFHASFTYFTAISRCNSLLFISLTAIS